MIATKGYAVKSATDTVKPFSFDRREVGPNDVKFEILFCGVCHSDIHQVRNEWGNAVYPMVPGHEIVGRVTEVGAQVNKFKKGDLAGVGCLVDSCRECDNCKKGLEQFCRKGATGTYNAEDKKHGGITYGGYSNQIIVDENYVVKVSDKLPLEKVAPLLCAGITTYSPLRHWKVGQGHKVAVVGLGGLGHMAVKFAVAFGADVTMLSTSPDKEQDAIRLGAHHFALTKDPEQLKGLASKFDFIIDTVSAPHDYNLYLGMLNTDGVMICVGVPPTPMEIIGFNLLGNRRSIAGSAIGGLPETQEMLDYCAEHNITSDVEVIDMAYINEAYERMLKSDVKYRFVIDMATL
ncbi:MAG: NAD(P)-dependent alcohol dehydrogenase [Janthinobacterium lividum]